MFENLPERPAQWEGMLKKALGLWESLESVDADPGDSEQQHIQEDIWKVVCKLVKAIYYCQIKAPLSRVQSEQPEEYAIHAAVGLTTSRSITLCPVIERLLRFHAGQLQVKEPIHGQLPLHVIASTMFQPDRCEILNGILDAYPHATTVKDDRGYYPLHLACQAKYPWKQGLESLFKTAPQIGELHCPCCPLELLAQQDCYDQSLDTVYALVQTDASLLS
eukprot:scaffold3077_cov162-Amphora_coffeaeformis.AAC.34